MPHAKKLIEVALPLEAINVASAREKSIRHGHPSTLHLWWARRPLAAARAVIFTSLVDDPDDPHALPAFVEACRQLPKGANTAIEDTPRMRLFDFIERLVTWEATTDEAILNTARDLIQIATQGNPPPLLDPFAGGGSIPLEAQRLGLEAHASDLNPVAVMINKAQIEIPPRFANRPPVNPLDRAQMFPSPLAPLPQGEKGTERIVVPPQLEAMMVEIARKLRREQTASEGILWEALRNRKLDGRKFRRQQPIGVFVLDFYCAEERLAVEVDGGIHRVQAEADQQRQQLIESLGIRFVRVTAEHVETNLPSALKEIQAAFLPSPVSGRGVGGEGVWRGAAGLAADVRYYGEWMRERAWARIGHLYPTHNGETVIAWLWARTVKSPNPAVDAHVPLVRSFILSKKTGRECWAKPIVENGQVRFEVTPGLPPKGEEGTMLTRKGAICIISGEAIPKDYIKAEGMAGRMGSKLMAIVTEGTKGRSYYSPDEYHVSVAQSAQPEWEPIGQIPDDRRSMFTPLYGLTEFRHLFTPRQLVALTTFSDLVAEARDQAHTDALAAGLADDGVPLRDGGRGALAYAEAVSVYLAFAVDKSSDYWSGICSWHNSGEKMRNTFGRQAIPMVWDYAEANPFSESTGNWMANIDWIWKVIDHLPANSVGLAVQQDAAHLNLNARTLSTDPPYYDNIGYADLSDFFYVWMRKSLHDVYPDIFGTLLVPKAPELIASPYRHGGKAAANAHFEGGMAHTFANIRRFVTHDYPLTVYYAFKQQDSDTSDEDDDTPPSPDPFPHKGGRGENPPLPIVGEGLGVRGITRASSGWETMLTSLIDSGFSIGGTWPIRTELSNRMVGAGTNALASSIVLVCRPRPTDAPSLSRRAFTDALRSELPNALQQMQSGNIAPVDLAQASIGPGMAIYSRYSRVLEADGTPLTIRTALGLINAALDEYLAEQDGNIDADTRFAVAWFEQFAFAEGEFGVADVLARAKNTSVTDVETSGVVVAGRGKVRLIHWKEYDPGTLTPSPSPSGGRGEAWDPQSDKRPTIWEATHHLIERLNTHGETGAALLLNQMPPEMATEARQLAYRLYSICERKSWSDHARDYNALVVSWAGVGEESARLRSAAAQGDATQQNRLL
jgi:putative DNA methylase